MDKAGCSAGQRGKATGRVKETLSFVAWTARWMLIPLAKLWKQEEGRFGKGRDKEYLNGLQDIQGEKGSLSSGERLRLKTRIWESEYSRMAEAPRVDKN